MVRPATRVCRQHSARDALRPCDPETSRQSKRDTGVQMRLGLNKRVHLRLEEREKECVDHAPALD